MKRTSCFLFFSLLFTLGIAQPVLNFTPISLSGPALVQPVDITSCGDGSGRLFIVEKRGTIRIVQNGAVLANFFLDIQTQVMNSGERGLLGMAFHPLYPDSPYVYVNYVINNTIINRISRFTLNPNNPNDLLETSQDTLLEQAGVQTNHKAGDLAFGPDGYLYIGMGDGGGGGDPTNAAQNIQTLLGKMLRIDINTTSPGLPYGIPPDNPYVGVTGLDEIWAKGMRNPWRISFDRETGDFWIGDVGQNEWEEVDMVPAGTPGGMNFGWDCREGNHNYEPGNCPGGTTFTWPVFEYPHSCNPCPVGFGASLTGGFVYRGSLYPVLEGCYVCADYVSNYLWMVKQTAWEPPAFTVFVQNGAGIVNALVTFGEDDNGELYASNLAGTLYAVSATGTLPIQWEDIIAVKIHKGNKIQWTIHQAFGIDYFEVQRSFKPTFDEFTSLAQVPAVLDQINYSYEYPYVASENVYYRIAAFMDDGSIEYSPIARIGPIAISGPSLGFDHEHNTWRIILPEDWRNGDVTLFDAQGKEVYQKKITDSQHIELSSPVVPGCYFVQITGNMGTWSDQVVW
jgi:glucose/arabinose dehydrogenase